MKALYEAISPLESNSFNVFLQQKKEFDYPWHYHPEFEITYILSSRGVRYVGNNFDDFYENDLVMVGSNLPHCWKNTGKQPNHASAIVIQWRADFLGEDWFQAKEFEAIGKLIALSEKGIRFREEIALQLRPLMLEMIDLPPFKRLITLLEIMHRLAETASYTVLCEEGFKHILNYRENERVNTILQFVKNNYATKITLLEVAAQVCMTEEAFSRFFSKIMKKPFFSFLNEYRINVACKLLIDTDLQVAQICYTSGYESLPFFYRQFKKFKGCAPQVYRIQYRKIC
ncbi:AraC family transcriptional regulator [Olivibacter sp. SDN3]|uniref:AraC family transcriptional regulator n=1 Tax=Olivibacter sp. SDN3 TaxID=2764720 RepID=UPI001651AE9F|nr:AraC family transcriptional regulator [Olivibacter sp. SDN3]QNL51737.1 AraC family transcriptional regulator [Olivibacter sp. SDN3]